MQTAPLKLPKHYVSADQYFHDEYHRERPERFGDNYLAARYVGNGQVKRRLITIQEWKDLGGKSEYRSNI